MKLFFDASATVAMLALEPGFHELSDRAEEYDTYLMSPMSKWETISALCRSHGFTAEHARGELQRLVEEQGIVTVPIGEQESELALYAFFKFGKGTGHPAKLNMGDCFAYACARANEASLLYKGDVFAHTDLA